MRSCCSRKAASNKGNTVSDAVAEGYMRRICRILLKMLLMVGNSAHFCSLEEVLLAEANSAKILLTELAKAYSQPGLLEC